MVNRKETTNKLSYLLENYINPHNDTRIYYAKEVTFDYYDTKPIRIDYMKFKPINNTISGIEHGDFYCYEIKSCIDDFNSNHGHNFIGDYNYYIMTFELYHEVKDKIPYYVGVLCPENDIYLMSIKKAKRIDRKRSALEMLLMMFRSANRENIKFNCQNKLINFDKFT